MTRRKSVPILAPVEPIPVPLYAHCGSFEYLTVAVTMLPSVNRKLKAAPSKRDGRQFYIDPAYAKREDEEVESLQKQLAVTRNWTTSGEDRYLIFCEFPFPTELKQDLHNPWKAICDCLGKAGVIHNDNRNMQECLTQIVSRTRNWAHITIYKFTSQTYITIPFQVLADQYLHTHITERNKIA